MRTLLLLGAINAFCAVALGAFGAHGLKKVPHITPEMIEIWKTGAQYQMYHALALVLLAALYNHLPLSIQGKARTAGYLFAAGCIIFGGSLYALTLTGIKVLGAITPIGGVCFLSGWALLAVCAFQMKGISEANR
jgi:uncharacterized membrane protein YgdD (TMEM256/DUF423 family)